MPRKVMTDGKGKVWLEEYELPPLGPKDVRGRAFASGISHGTETFTMGQDTGKPKSLGYSVAGEITEVGAEVTRLKPGDYVFTYAPHSPVFQQSQDRCWKLPPQLPPEHGQFLALLSVAYNGIMEARLTLGETVAVFGLGTVGQLTCQLTRRAGARKVIGVDPVALRRHIAEENGISGTVDPASEDLVKRVREINDGEDADCAIETSGVIAGLNGAMKVVREQSDVICLSLYRGSTDGLQLSDAFHFKRLKLRTAQFTSVHPELMVRWTHERRMRTGAEMLPELSLANLITHRFRLEETEKAYQLLSGQSKEMLQIVFLYD